MVLFETPMISKCLSTLYLLSPHLCFIQGLWICSWILKDTNFSLLFIFELSKYFSFAPVFQWYCLTPKECPSMSTGCICCPLLCFIKGLICHLSLKKKVREKSRECHNHKPQPFPDPKRKRKPTNLNKHKPNKRTESTKISSVFPKRGNRNP